MEKAKVYFTDFRTKAFGDGLPTKLKKMIKKAGIGHIDMKGRFVAIKLHFGSLATSVTCAPTMRVRLLIRSRILAVSLS